MLALIYLGLAIALGDLLCRHFYRFASVPHRWAAATLVGILLSTWYTYLGGLAFANTAEPLLWADLLFFVVAAAAICWLSKKSPTVQLIEARPPGRSAYDWVTLGVLFFAAGVLLMGTLYVNKQGRIRVFGIEASDFALQSAIAQSFALGHNFPPESPYYTGQPIHYDFLFYFQAGNLELLGLNLAWAVGVLSVLGLTGMLALVMALGELLFNSRVVARVGAALAFFPGSLAFLPFWQSKGSIGDAPLVVAQFVNQRQLPSAIGIFLLIAVFLVTEYRQKLARTEATANPAADHTRIQVAAKLSTSFIFSGFLLGALPLWDTGVFIGGAATLSFLLILFPCRWEVTLLGITAAVVALPQVAFSLTGEIASRQHSFLHWGYSVDNPAITKIITYIVFAFGTKWPAIIVALILASWFQWRFFIALCSLFLLSFCVQLSTETLADYEFLNVWLVGANLFAACGLWRLCKLRMPRIVGPFAAIALTAGIVGGGIIDLASIRNSSYVEVNYEKDDLVKWLSKNTKPKDAFLTDRFASHPVLLAGRRIFLGSPTLLGSARYDVAKRETMYRQMFESKNPRRVYELLKENNIAYVAFDDGVRHGQLIKNPNEYLYVSYFQKIYEDKENRYGRLVIYKVPERVPANLANMDLSEPSVNAFQGGKGSGKGQFDNPHGLALDTTGNIFVADTDNGRIEKFSPRGTFITSIKQFEAPNGIVVDRAGNIYVAEIGSKHRVRKLGPDGTFIAEWAPALYGPRKMAIGPDDSVYVVDSGRNRIVKFSPDGRVLTTWGSEGSGDGQFRGLTSVAIDSANKRAYVADAMNGRIQVFDLDGKYLAKWSVPGWGQSHGYEDLAIDSQTGQLYASSAHMDSILVFNLQGDRLGTLAPMPPNKLEGPSALALAKDKLFVLNAGSARVSAIDLQNR
jgi:DNA-binding beta-propeller fold protein YncE